MLLQSFLSHGFSGYGFISKRHVQTVFLIQGKRPFFIRLKTRWKIQSSKFVMLYLAEELRLRAAANSIFMERRKRIFVKRSKQHLKMLKNIVLTSVTGKILNGSNTSTFYILLTKTFSVSRI